MSKRILFACNQVPYYGGANTTLYLLFKALQRRGLDVHYLNLVDDSRLSFYTKIFNSEMGNPCKLYNVHNITLGEDSIPDGLFELLDNIKPDLILAKNFTAPNVIMEIDPAIKMWFFPSQCDQIRNAIYQKLISSELNALEIIKEPGGSIPRTWNPEFNAVKNSDRIICNSMSTKYWFKYFYPELVSKISNEVLWTAFLINDNIKNYSASFPKFEYRSIDILFVANRWSRVEKNLDMVMRLRSKLKNTVRMHLVGECNINSDDIIIHQFKHYKEVLELMKNTKTVVSASVYDPAPNVLYEASLLGCNIVASKNCGNWELCCDTLLVDEYNVDNYADKIYKSLIRKYDDNMNLFLKDDVAEKLSQMLNGT